MQRLQRFFSDKFYPWLLLAICTLSYGLYLPWLGFYWDDWPFLWFSEVLSPAALFQIEIHRPLSGLLFTLGTQLFGTNAILWQLLLLITRWLSALALVWVLKVIWPRHKAQVYWVGILFLVFPGFQEQYIAINNSRHLLPLIWFLLSLGFMLRGVRTPQRYWTYTLISLVLGVLHMLSTEYYVGLELVRLPLLFLMLPADKLGDRFKQTLRHWLPYLLLFIFFFVWRLLIFDEGYYEVDLLGLIAANPLNGIAVLLSRVGESLAAVTWQAWAQVFDFPAVADFGIRPLLYFWALVGFAAIGLAFYFWNLKDEEAPGDAFWPQALFLALFSLAVAGLPFWGIRQLKVGLVPPWDRLTLPFIFGSSLLLVSLIELVGRKAFQKTAIVIVFAALSLGFQFQRGADFRRDWDFQRDFFHQLSIRVPGLEPGTIVFIQDMPTVSTDNSLTAPLNWMYAPELDSFEMPYHVINLNERIRVFGADSLKPETPLSYEYRLYTFNSLIGQAIVVYDAPPFCLRVIDPLVDKTNPYLPKNLRRMREMSHLEYIQVDATPRARLPENLVGPEPAAGWCSYFQQADLYRQMQNWDGILALQEEAFAYQSASQHAGEFLPFVQAYAHSGMWAEAVALTQAAVARDPAVEEMYCHAWVLLAEDLPDMPRSVEDEMDCP